MTLRHILDNSDLGFSPVSYYEYASEKGKHFASDVVSLCNEIVKFTRKLLQQVK
jgi:hypothetical protein